MVLVELAKLLRPDPWSPLALLSPGPPGRSPYTSSLSQGARILQPQSGGQWKMRLTLVQLMSCHSLAMTFGAL
jgi:hypothetical protein